MREGHGVRRRTLMTNAFVLVGPPDDPAQVAAAKDVDEAFVAIARAHHPFVSRGDRSGTHLRELAIWQRVNLKPEGTWYLSVGVGQGEALRLAAERGAYMLVDRSTFIAQGIASALKVLQERGDDLTNVYSVIEVRQPPGREDRARASALFADALLAPRVQDLISRFGADRFGRALFSPAPK